MSRSIDESFYKSVEWKRCRESYLQSVGFYCELCKSRGIYEPAKVVHHKIPLTTENYTDPAISLNFNNLQALCTTCHNTIHHKQPRRYFIDEYGKLIF